MPTPVRLILSRTRMVLPRETFPVEKLNWAIGIWGAVIGASTAAGRDLVRHPRRHHLSGALFLLIWGLIKGSGYGWGSAPTLAFLGGAVLVGLLFVIRESRARQPLRLFRSASLAAGI